MAYTNIDDPSAHFQTKTYTGTSGIHDVTLDGNSDMQPDFVWFKNRTVGYVHHLYDSSRGVTKALYSNGTNAEATISNGLTRFDPDGFRVSSAAAINEDEIVCWNWKANGGTTSSNTDGDLTSTVQFNSTAGFSIVTYTGKSPIEPLDVGHGMGEVPDVIIVKNRSTSRLWAVYHKELTSPAEKRYIQLNTSTYGEQTNSTLWRNEAPTTTVFKTGENAAVNQPNENFVAYCWKERQGYSKFGKYVGNGSTDGSFIYTGFKPAVIILRRTDSGRNWNIITGKTSENVIDLRLNPNDTAAEYTGTATDFLSNGFKLRNTNASANASGGTYIYMAFAENPFTTSTGIPTTAR